MSISKEVLNRIAYGVLKAALDNGLTFKDEYMNPLLDAIEVIEKGMPDLASYGISYTETTVFSWDDSQGDDDEPFDQEEEDKRFGQPNYAHRTL